jgi:hypothetical protein
MEIVLKMIGNYYREYYTHVIENHTDGYYQVQDTYSGNSRHMKEIVIFRAT